MKKTLFEDVVFTVMMSFSMTYAMELYNLSMQQGLSYGLFLEVFKEVWWITLIVAVIQWFFGGPLARRRAFRIIDPAIDRPFLVTLVIGACTVCVMCPTMSMVATILFKHPGVNVIPIWLTTLVKNFPMAFFWQLIFAGPLVRYLHGKIFRGKKFIQKETAQEKV